MKEMIFLMVFMSGVFFGFGIRLMYYMITGRDIPIFKPRLEVDRLRAEARRIEEKHF